MQLINKKYWFATGARPCNRYKLEWARKDFITALNRCSENEAAFALLTRCTSKREAFVPANLAPKVKAAYRKQLRNQAYTIHMKARAAARRAKIEAEIAARHAHHAELYGEQAARTLSGIESLDMANFHTAHNRRDHADMVKRFEAEVRS